MNRRLGQRAVIAVAAVAIAAGALALFGGTAFAGSHGQHNNSGAPGAPAAALTRTVAFRSASQPVSSVKVAPSRSAGLPAAELATAGPAPTTDFPGARVEVPDVSGSLPSLRCVAAIATLST